MTTPPVYISAAVKYNEIVIENTVDYFKKIIKEHEEATHKWYFKQVENRYGIDKKNLEQIDYTDFRYYVPSSEMTSAKYFHHMKIFIEQHADAFIKETFSEKGDMGFNMMWSYTQNISKFTDTFRFSYQDLPTGSDNNYYSYDEKATNKQLLTGKGLLVFKVNGDMNTEIIDNTAYIDSRKGKYLYLLPQMISFILKYSESDIKQQVTDLTKDLNLHIIKIYDDLLKMYNKATKHFWHTKLHMAVEGVFKIGDIYKKAKKEKKDKEATYIWKTLMPEKAKSLKAALTQLSVSLAEFDKNVITAVNKIADDIPAFSKENTVVIKKNDFLDMAEEMFKLLLQSPGEKIKDSEEYSSKFEKLGTQYLHMSEDMYVNKYVIPVVKSTEFEDYYKKKGRDLILTDITILNDTLSSIGINPDDYKGYVSNIEANVKQEKALVLKTIKFKEDKKKLNKELESNKRKLQKVLKVSINKYVDPDLLQKELNKVVPFLYKLITDTLQQSFAKYHSLMFSPHSTLPKEVSPAAIRTDSHHIVDEFFEIIDPISLRAHKETIDNCMEDLEVRRAIGAVIHPSKVLYNKGKSYKVTKYKLEQSKNTMDKRIHEQPDLIEINNKLNKRIEAIASNPYATLLIEDLFCKDTNDVLRTEFIGSHRDTMVKVIKDKGSELPEVYDDDDLIEIYASSIGVSDFLKFFMEQLDKSEDLQDALVTLFLQLEKSEESVLSGIRPLASYINEIKSDIITNTLSAAPEDTPVYMYWPPLGKAV